MWNIIKQKIKEQRNSVLIYIGSLIGYALLMIGMFPEMKKMDLEALMESYPPEIAKFFGESGMASYSTIEGFLSMEYLSFFFILILTFYIGSAAGSAIAGQIEKRTADFNLSQPITRTKILLSEATVALAYIALTTIATSVSIIVLCQLFNIEISVKGVSSFAILATLFGWAHYGIAIFLSSVLRSKIGVMLLTVGFSLGSYVLLSLTRLVEKIKDFDSISIYKLYNPELAIRDANLNENHALILGSIALAGIILAIFSFNKKDI